MMYRCLIPAALALVVMVAANQPGWNVAAEDPVAPKAKGAAPSVEPRPIADDPAVKYDYDIVYVRAPRRGDDEQIFWTDVFAPLQAEPGSDLMLLHPDGREEVLVAAGDDAIADPFVCFDGGSVYYARIHNVRPGPAAAPASQSADIFKIHVKSRKIVQLTHQEFTPNTGVVKANLKAPGVYNLAPCPLPGGKVMFTSNRNGFVPTKDYQAFWAKGSNKPFLPTTTLQLFVMDDDGANIESVGHLNINGAMHPTILKDGRVMFSSFESQGLRDMRTWAIWTIHPDGSNWAPLVSALGPSSETVRHFMTQLSDGHIVWEEYYIQHTLGFGTYYKRAPRPRPTGSRSSALPAGTIRNYKYAKPRNQFFTSLPFSPPEMEEVTPFARQFNAPAEHADPKDAQSPYLGKVTHPSGAPDNHLLTVWSPGPVHGVGAAGNLHGFKKPAVDSGIYLIKEGKVIDRPDQMLLVKNDPKYNEQWPRALVPYKRIYGVDEPARLAPVANDGKRSPHLPEGTPFGLIGSSSLYKRESYPNGVVPQGKVTAAYPGRELFGVPEIWAGHNPLGGGGINWGVQGADAGKYENSDIHAIRIVATEPTTDPRLTDRPTRRWLNAANERLRILGEIPVRKFERDPKGAKQPLDPDGNPDTSFLVKIPADIAWTFQTLDKNGLVLNMAQTWHQLRPGEVRYNCGGCHAHSQKPTDFHLTAAARPDYAIFDLTRQTPLLTSKDRDQSGKRWDVEDTTGLRLAEHVLRVEYYRDIKPILQRSCTACHTQKWDKPAGNLVLDDDRPMQDPTGYFGGRRDKLPGTFVRLAADPIGKFGYPSPQGGSCGQASRYVRHFEARRSLLAWKVYGQRLDGWKNEDFAYEAVPGDPKSLEYQGKPFTRTPDSRFLINLAYTGSSMPPPDAVAGTYAGPDGQKIKVAPLSDEDRRTIGRWIDLGCPIDLDFDPAHPQARGHGWMEDDNRPTLTLTLPRAGANRELTRILVGMDDYDSGLDLSTFEVVADVALDDLPAGSNLASRFKPKTPGVWELVLAKPLTELAKGKLTVSVKDKQGNLARVERTFSVAEMKP